MNLLFMRYRNIYIATQHSYGIKFSLLPTPKLSSSDKVCKSQSKTLFPADKWTRNLALRKSEYWSYLKINSFQWDSVFANADNQRDIWNALRDF